MHAAQICSMWRWSVPQHPPSTVICGCLDRMSQYWAPSSTGSPSSRSGASLSSRWLRREALARTPRMRVVQDSGERQRAAEVLGSVALLSVLVGSTAGLGSQSPSLYALPKLD